MKASSSAWPWDSPEWRADKVRIDSLFLDEGFCTLDEEALDTALESLGSLRQEGKLIGVISHAAAAESPAPDAGGPNRAAQAAPPSEVKKKA